MTIVNMDGQNISPQPLGKRDMKAELAALEVIDPDEEQPTGCRILFRIASVDDISPGGIILSDQEVVRRVLGCTSGTLIRASAASFIDPQTGDRYLDAPDPDDRILLTKYAGNAYRDEEGNIYRFANDTDVVSVRKKGGKNE